MKCPKGQRPDNIYCGALGCQVHSPDAGILNINRPWHGRVENLSILTKKRLRSWITTWRWKLYGGARLSTVKTRNN
jgi:hypothetical protein